MCRKLERKLDIATSKNVVRVCAPECVVHKTLTQRILFLPVWLPPMLLLLLLLQPQKKVSYHFVLKKASKKSVISVKISCWHIQGKPSRVSVVFSQSYSSITLVENWRNVLHFISHVIQCQGKLHYFCPFSSRQTFQLKKCFNCCSNLSTFFFWGLENTVSPFFAFLKFWKWKNTFCCW